MITRATTATLDDLDDESDVSVLLVNEENKHFGISWVKTFTIKMEQRNKHKYIFIIKQKNIIFLTT